LLLPVSFSATSAARHQFHASRKRELICKIARGEFAANAELLRGAVRAAFGLRFFFARRHSFQRQALSKRLAGQEALFSTVFGAISKSLCVSHLSGMLRKYPIFNKE
jgi:hypothetical protein